jgi:ABC-type dipeptide/oligopeptide/nickel transport system permease component
VIGFVVRRAAGALVTFVLATAVVFTVTLALPGDPARVLAGRRQVPEATLDAIRERYGLDSPLPVRYVRWLGRLLRGDLGESYVSRRGVSEVLADAVPVTLTLLALAVTAEVLVALVLGTMAGLRRNGRLDRALVLACTGAIATPLFVVASVAQLYVGLRWNLLPVAGTDAGLRSFVLPAGVLALSGAAFALRIVRSDVLEVSQARHVVVARAKGVSDGQVTRRHVVRNAVGPFVTFMGLEVGALAGGSVVVERVFNLPGIGGQMARAISQRDAPLIVGFTVCVIAVYVAVDLVVDVAVALLDPRLQSVSG